MLALAACSGAPDSKLPELHDVRTAPAAIRDAAEAIVRIETATAYGYSWEHFLRRRLAGQGRQLSRHAASSFEQAASSSSAPAWHGSLLAAKHSYRLMKASPHALLWSL